MSPLEIMEGESPGLAEPGKGVRILARNVSLHRIVQLIVDFPFSQTRRPFPSPNPLASSERYEGTPKGFHKAQILVTIPFMLLVEM